MSVAARPAQRFYVNARAIVERSTAGGLEVLLQVRERHGEPRRLEFPGSFPAGNWSRSRAFWTGWRVNSARRPA